jgi:hypothetical protein
LIHASYSNTPNGVRRLLPLRRVRARLGHRQTGSHAGRALMTGGWFVGLVLLAVLAVAMILGMILGKLKAILLALSARGVLSQARYTATDLTEVVVALERIEQLLEDIRDRLPEPSSKLALIACGASRKSRVPRDPASQIDDPNRS